ncbi:MAG: Aerobic respiration control sensor protein ArcB [Legionellaceae bacterium]
MEKLLETKKLKVLVVEDDTINQKLLSAMLTMLNCDFDIVSDGKSALQRFDGTYDVVVMDLGLPDMHGIEVTKHIREKEVGKRPLIIACTANTHQYKESCLAAGMDDFLQKPFELVHLESILKKHQ